jgi:type IV secretion system protein VirD4
VSRGRAEATGMRGHPRSGSARRRGVPTSGHGLGGDVAIGAGVLAILGIEAVSRLERFVTASRLPWAWWCLGAVGGFLVLLLVAIVVGKLLAGRSFAGTPTQGASTAGWATARDLAPLLVREVPGDRLVLGETSRRLVAGEARQSVLVVGPSQSGKTTSLAVPALLEWDGPVLATSVKTDLVRATVQSRRARGEVAIFDPTGVTGLPAWGWSPLSEATSWAGARRVADSLCSVGRRPGGIEDASYWYAAAERLLAPLLRAAALVGGSMGDVVRWLDEGSVTEPLLALELGNEREAVRVAKSCVAMEERQRSSVYSTAQTVLAAYGDPIVVASERSGRQLGPTWLLDGGAGTAGDGRAPRTVYCCSPARDQARLSPVFLALVRQVLDHAFDRSARAGRALDPPLLVVLDEAANIAPLEDLDQVLATAAGHGVSLMTVWQDLAQVESRYGERWATIVNNHRAKVVCPGVSDPRTLELLSALIGDVEVAQRSTSRTGEGSWTESESPWRVPVAPAGWIRRLPKARALVVYGSMPPALVTMRRPFAASTEGRF